MPTTITGKITNLDATTPGTSSFVRFWLRGTRGTEPRINGTGAIAPQSNGTNFYVDIVANSSGNVSGSIYSTRDSTGLGAGEIEVGGSYTAAYYGMQIYSNGIAGPEVPVHAKTGAVLDISNVTPLFLPPVIASPTGDSTYARLDAGNQPFTGNLGIPKITTYNGIATVSNGIPSIIKAVDLTAQTAALSNVTLYAGTASGQYRLSWNADVTTAAGTSSTLGAFSVQWTNPEGVIQIVTAAAQTNAGSIVTTNAGNVTTSQLLGIPILVNAGAGSSILYSMSYASNPASAMNYNLHVRLEAV